MFRILVLLKKLYKLDLYKDINIANSMMDCDAYFEKDTFFAIVYYIRYGIT